MATISLTFVDPQTGVISNTLRLQDSDILRIYAAWGKFFAIDNIDTIDKDNSEMQHIQCPPTVVVDLLLNDLVARLSYHVVEHEREEIVNKHTIYPIKPESDEQ